MGCWLAGAAACADEIVIDGARYKDVLVMQTSSSYYVQVPWEGRTLSARTDEVDASTVSINRDQYYRDELKEQYDEAKARRDEGTLASAPDDPAFDVGRGGGSQVDVRALLDGGGGGAGGSAGGGGFGMGRAQFEQMAGGMGVVFAPGPGRNGMPSVIAKDPDGMTIELFGAPGELAGLEIKATGPAAQVDTSIPQLQMIANMLAPSIAPEIMAMVGEAKASQQSTRNAGGLKADISMRPDGANVAFTMTVMAQ